MKVARDSYGEVKLIDSNAVNYTCLKYFYKQVYGFEPPSQHEVLLVGENMERRWASDDLLDGVAAKDLFDKGKTKEFTIWSSLAQVLMMSNEFMYVD